MCVVTIIIIMALAITTIPLFKPSLAQSNQLFNMTYVYFGGANTFVQQVDATNRAVHVVSPNYFDVTPEGNLDITWMLRTSFITEMHKRGIKVVPFLANHWHRDAGINGLINRDQLARDIAAAIEEYNLDGVNVDIEGVGHQYRNEHTDLVRLLRQYIPKHKEVSVAIAANPNGWNTGWHGFYDERELARYSDYLMIMAYDESWGGPDSPIGPVASLNFQERSIQYVLNEGVPKDKIVLGLPFYGRMWKTDGPTIADGPIEGMGLAHRRVPEIVNKFNGKVTYDTRRRSAYVNFRIPPGQHEFQGGKKLTEGDYIIWFDNEQAKKEKLRLPQKYGIKGTGSWALSLEEHGTWNYYSLWLNGRFFDDVPVGHWGEESILFVANRGWMAGTASTNFSPEAELTRAQGAVILVRALGEANRNPNRYEFIDTTTHWARKEIEIARELGMVSGLGNNRFGPDDPLTREQLAAILNNIFQYDFDRDKRNPFPDIGSDDWAFESLMAIYQRGFLSGFEDGTFRPRAKSTRVQMAALMNRMEAEFEKYQNQ
ncbi:hypothetical protein BKP37_11010 [Anaerobacillus alkalilacustris]|uniref:Glycoside hydrolase n=1 Tax=Anaerobacillus alkalilacustris TaxID=393763 RepID=A0A1S2LLF4_9BACI|nr:hypothetical protein BKP37_11010 [Anaerobacillus alkalilacustris]